MTDTATVTIKGDEKALEASLARSHQLVKGFAVGVGTAFASIGAFFAVGQIISWGRAFVHEAEEEELALKKLEQVLKSTGNTTGLTMEEMEALGKELTKISTFSDDAARSANTLFAQMGNIKGDVFKRALLSSADLAAFMRADLPQAASTLSRALTDPERGMLRLRRAGIIFTESERERIKVLAAGGKTTEAQTALLDALEKKVGGQAAALLDTFSGKWTQFKNRMSEVGESIGTEMLPVLASLMPIIEKTAKTIEIMVRPLLRLTAWVANAAVEFVNWLGFVDALQTGFIWLTEVIETVAVAIGEYLAPYLEMGKTFLEDFGTAVWETGKAIVEGMTPYVTAIVEKLMEWGSVIWDYVKPALVWLGEMGIVAFTALQTVIQNFGDVAMIAIENFALQFVKAFNILQYYLTVVVPDNLAWFGRNWRAVFHDAWEFLKTVITNMSKNIFDFFSAVTGWFKGEGFNFEWTGLTEGFQKTMEDLPKHAKRVKGEIEESLEVDIGKRATRVGAAFNANLEKNKKYLEGLSREAFARKSGDTGKEREKSAEGGTMPKDEEKTKPKDKDKDSKVGTIEDLLAMNKRISEGAAGTGKDDKIVKATLEAAKMNSEEHEKTRQALKEQTGALEDIAENTGDLEGVGALVDD